MAVVGGAGTGRSGSTTRSMPSCSVTTTTTSSAFASQVGRIIARHWVYMHAFLVLVLSPSRPGSFRARFSNHGCDLSGQKLDPSHFTGAE